MLYTGYAEPIQNIRVRKSLTQKDAVTRVKAAMPHAKVHVSTWSKYENGGKRLGDTELPIILLGLDCTETEIWQESVRVQKTHYHRRADEVREEAPQYGTSMAAGIMQGLWALDADALPPKERSWFSQERAALAAALSDVLSLITLLKERYWESKGNRGSDMDHSDDS